jgi:HEAT repeats
MKVRNFLCIMILFIATGCSQQGEKWELAKRYNTIKGYERFISLYPESAYADSARKSLYKIARTVDTIEAYEGFISKHPKNMYADSARKVITNIRYKIARSENTIPAYEKFLTFVPEGPLADLAKSGIKTILDDRHPAFRNVKTIQWSPKALTKDGKFVLPKVFRITERLFKTSGITLVKGDTMKYDAQLILSAKGTAIGGYYTGSLSGYHYTGASVSIRLKLRASGKQIVNKSFNGRRSKSYFITSSYKKRSNAPWSGAVNKSGYDVGLIKILSDVLGRTGIINALLKEKVISSKQNKLLKKTLEKKYGLSIKDVAMIALDNYNWKVRQNGVNLLKSLKDSTTVKPLLTVLLKDKHKSVRYSASRALTNYADQFPLEVLLEALHDSYNSVRSQAVYLLGRKKDSRVFKLLLTLLLDKNKSVRYAAGNALNNYAKQCSLEVLLEKLNDSKYQVRSKIAYVLGKRKDYRAFEPLIVLLSDKNRSVRSSAERALRTISGKTFKKRSSYTRYSYKKKSSYWTSWWSKNKKKFIKE